MKIQFKIVFLIPVILLLANKSYAQNGTYNKPWILGIDFNDMNIDSLPTSLNKGEFYQVQVENINPNLYSVNIEYKDSTLEALDFPSFNFVGLENLIGLLNELALGEKTTKSVTVSKIGWDRGISIGYLYTF